MRCFHCLRDKCFNVMRECDIASLGGYCSFLCLQEHFRFPPENGLDSQTADDYGINAFSRRRIQMGAHEEEMQQWDDTNTRSFLG